MSRVFTVTAERGRDDWWVLNCDEVGAVSQTKRLSRAADEMREAIAHLAKVPEESFEIDVVPLLPSEFAKHSARARELRNEAARAQSRAASESRLAAATLKAAGLSLRDIGHVMQISHQRAAQLTTAADPDR
ncbi:MAG TPA: hypothetical protein GXZ30_01550 [Propionibacterium sp.]|nr:hypothetical protein [Propionibacterium sp.]